ncbi:MAG: S1 family peptidase [Deltaproteobacteria bacterium]|nr:S1 family peptidase [Deltaproteobacteria bacterium]
MRRSSGPLMLRLLTAAFMLGQAACAGDSAHPETQLTSRTSAIVNGAPESGFAAVGAIVVAGTGSNSGCTATLVGRRTLITAGHCVAGQGPVVFYPSGLQGPRFAAATVTMHPSYVGGNDADLAVVRLMEDVGGIEPVELATRAPRVGESVVLVGFGKPLEGQGSFGVKRRATNTVGTVTDQLFTVYGAAASAGNICDGDSGGPTFALREGRPILLGVHSTKGGSCGDEGNDMRVDIFRAWITRQVALERAPRAAGDHDLGDVLILSPTSGFEAADRVEVSVLASSPALLRVDLLVDGTVAASKRQAPFRFEIGPLRGGNRVLQAVVQTHGGSVASALVTVRVRGGDSVSAGAGTFGTACTESQQCGSKLCFGTSEERAGYCTQACTANSACGAGYHCVERICRPRLDAGDFGAACQTANDCSTGLCLVDPLTNLSYCTARCNKSGAACAAGATCLPDGADAVCGPPADLADRVGGCRLGAGGGRDLGLLLPLLLGLALFFARRR